MKKVLFIGVVVMLAAGLLAGGVAGATALVQRYRGGTDVAEDGVAAVVHGLEEAVEKLETEGMGETQAAEAMYADPVGDEERGVLLLGVTPDSPAAEIGLRRGDIILAVDGEEVDSPSELHTAIRAQEGGDNGNPAGPAL